MLKAMREIDRELHEHFYPQIFFKEIYLLEGGFKEFFSEHRNLCQGDYTPMKAEEHKMECKELFRECTQ